MDDNKVINRERQEQVNTTKEILTTAVATTAATVFFYRNGGARKMAKALTEGHRFVKDLSAIAKKRLSGPEDITISKVKQAYQDTREAYKKMHDNLGVNKVELDVNNPRTLFGYINSLTKSLQQRKRSVVKKEYARTSLINPAQEAFERDFSAEAKDYNTNLQFKSYISEISHSIDDEVLQARIRKKYREQFTARQKEIANGIDDFIAERLKHREKEEAAIKDKVNKQFKDLIEKGTSISELEEQFGTNNPEKKTFIAKAVEETFNDRAATVGDILTHKDEILQTPTYSLLQKDDKNVKFISNVLEDLEKFHERIKKEQGEEAAQRFLAITPDRYGLRVAKSADGKTEELVSNTATRKIVNDLLEVGAGTLPGKILRLRDFQYDLNVPALYHFGKGTTDTVLAAILNKNPQTGSQELDSSYYKLGKSLYRATDDGVEKVDDPRVANLKLISSRYGTTQRVLNQLTGNTRYQKASNTIFQKLDIGQDRERYSGAILERLQNRLFDDDDPNKRINVFSRLFNPSIEEKNNLVWARLTPDKKGSIDTALEYTDAAHLLEKLLHENTYELSYSAIEKLLPNTQNARARKYLELLQIGNDEDFVNAFMKSRDDYEPKPINKGLQKLFTSIAFSQHDGTRSVDVIESRENTHLSSSLTDLFKSDADNETLGFAAQLRKELGKEALLQHGLEGSYTDREIPKVNYQKILDLVKNSDLNKADEVSTRRLAMLSIFQKKAGLDLEEGQTTDLLWNEYDRLRDILYASTDNEVNNEFRSTAQKLIKEKVDAKEVSPGLGIDNISSPYTESDWIHINQVTSPLDLIKSMNDYEKFKSTSKQFVLQFGASRNTPDAISTAILAPYFMLSRLSDDLNSVGLGFSRESMGGLAQLTGAFAFKRILPVAVGATYYEWADDTSQQATGTSITGAAANGLADVDLGIRKVFDNVGLTDWLKEEKSINPIMQYWGDKNEFMGYDERKKWYESGYEPVRKGAWWTFGGIAEARGSEITYWQPSFDRRINSDYLDKSLYDGYYDKWSHSLLPTPTNPFSPINAILDPYWLERKHEDDRPYPVSGPMFAEGTPWGAILNPTVGDLIKPQIELHPWRLHNGVDIMSVLDRMNNYIKDKAQSDNNAYTFSWRGGTVTPVDYTSYNAASSDSSIATVNITNNGQGTVNIAGPTGQGFAFTPEKGVQRVAPITVSNTLTASDPNSTSVLLSGGSSTPIYTTADSDSAPSGLLAGNNLSFRKLTNSSIYDPKEGEVIATDQNGNLGVISPKSNNPYVDTSFTLSESLTMDAMINGDDWHIKTNLRDAINRADPLELLHETNSRIKEQAKDVASASDEGIVSPEKLRYFTPSKGMALLDDPSTVAELINQGKGADLVTDLEQSSRLITGIYGYMANASMGFGDSTGKQIAKSSDMTSFSRSFWDSNFGGAGGDVMEIVRRFIPTYSRGTIVNPLKNTMPDWLPESFQFGDPATSIEKGEMRLPGKGYESLNNLHPDMYGTYGAFDRYKILADVAPFSPEFKLWKQIAKKTVTDPNLVEEMSDIQDRVNQQGKKHDFYNYNVIGRGLDYHNIVVSEILDHGKFRSGDTIYKLAGATVKGNDNENVSQVMARYIHPGDEITIAVDQDQYAGTNNDATNTINAAVFNQDGQNVANLMMENGDAQKRKGDTSAAATLVNYSGTQRILAYGSELIAHADVPWLSDQFLRVRTPLESYEAEQTYGTPYQSWSHPINTFLLPAMERAIHESTYVPPSLWRSLSRTEGLSKSSRFMLDAGFVLTNRGAFVGAALSNLIYPGKGKPMMKAAQLGGNLGIAAHFISGGNGNLDEMYSGAMLGYKVAQFMEKKAPIVGAAIGAGVGLGYRQFTGDYNWIPERTHRKWEMEEYFDRLTYLKYMGLYHAASEKAKDEEGVDVEAMQKRLDKQEEGRRNALDRMKNIKESLKKVGYDTPAKDELMKLLNSRINALAPETSILQGGEWTRTALIYKQAAENTITALKKGSSWSQIVTALPTNDREYFMEFVKEGNPDKRKEIMQVASPQLKKALNIAWGRLKEDPDIDKENRQFFKRHNLPKPAWVGWRPDVDLKDIKVKTIDNADMNLSDFGYYESQLRNPKVKAAPELHMRGHTASLNSNLQRIMQGQGLENVNISITPASSGSGTQIMTNLEVYTGMKDLQKMADNSLKQGTA